jgi:hypothetical protein
MMHVVVGTDTYGRVKAVDKTTIVTMFSMVQLLPVAPIKSYYVWGPATSEVTGVPFLASIRSIKLRGVPLVRVDRTSAAFAYVRAALAALVLVGFIGTFSGLIFSANGKPMDDFALTVIRLAEGCLATGVAGGVLTYIVPTTSRRERAIRTYCGEMLGVCIDPGRVVPEVAVAVREMLPQFASPARAGVIRPRSEYVQELILTRCDAATAASPDCEALTDELLDQLRHLDRVAPAQAAEAEPGAARDTGRM